MFILIVKYYSFTQTKATLPTLGGGGRGDMFVKSFLYIHNITIVTVTFNSESAHQSHVACAVLKHPRLYWVWMFSRPVLMCITAGYYRLFLSKQQKKRTDDWQFSQLFLRQNRLVLKKKITSNMFYSFFWFHSDHLAHSHPGHVGAAESLLLIY